MDDAADLATRMMRDGCVGAVLGAIGLTTLGAALISASPSLRRDGQSGMIVCATIPFGAGIGFVTGIVIAIILAYREWASK